jgi:hypothetical protein
MESVWTETAPSTGSVRSRPDDAAGGVPPGDPGPRTVAAVLVELMRDPGRYLISRWNWKSALMSSLVRATIFFFTNLVAGWHAALGAMLAELILRSATSGFYGALTEAFASARPSWAAITTAMVLLPCVSHSLEFLVHWLRHTPKLGLSITTSMAFTAISTAFNLFAMQRGALIVGHGSRPLQEDLSRVPGLIAEFLLAGPRIIVSGIVGRKRGR